MLSFLTETLIISFIIWARLIRELLPVEVSGEIYSLRFWLSTYLFLFFLLFTIVYSIKVYKKLRVIDQDGYITRGIKNFLGKHEKLTKFIAYVIMNILESPMFVWILLYDSSPFGFKRFVHGLCFQLGGFLLNYVFPRPDVPGKGRIRSPLFRELFVITLLVYIPRLFCFTIFLYEIAINHKIDLFYTISPLLLLPLIFKSCRWIFSETIKMRMKASENDYIQSCTFDKRNRLKKLFLYLSLKFLLKNLKYMQMYIKTYIISIKWLQTYMLRTGFMVISKH